MVADVGWPATEKKAMPANQRTAWPLQWLAAIVALALGLGLWLGLAQAADPVQHRPIKP